MKIKCGDQIFDPNVTPCMVVLTDQDKRNISRMLPGADRYAAFPDAMSEVEAERFMADPRLPKDSGLPVCPKPLKLVYRATNPKSSRTFHFDGAEKVCRCISMLPVGNELRLEIIHMSEEDYIALGACKETADMVLG